jgi:glycosyltransferase involved in cell wall biosynthesis
MPSVLFVGDAAVSTGFARCTHAACDALHDAGWTVDVIGVNYFGDPHEHPYRIWPSVAPFDGCQDPFGVGRLGVLAGRLSPDVIVLLTDPWHVQTYLSRFTNGQMPVPVVGWLAVDGKNQKLEQLGKLARIAVWTEFAADELRACGYDGELDIVPLGVDTERFYPLGKKGPSRERLFGSADTRLPLSEDAFIVGVVGRNQWPRKRLDLSIEYFADWARDKPNAYLYVHSAPTGERGYDIASLAKYHGARVIHGEPHIGNGVDDEAMLHMYNSLDVYMTTTQGEGWGLPTSEAMACAVPCIVPDWSGLGSWTGDAAIHVPCSGTAVSAPINGKAYTLGGIADKQQFVKALDSLCNDPGLRLEYGNRGLELAKSLSWASTGQAFKHVLESALEDVHV